MANEQVVSITIPCSAEFVGVARLAVSAVASRMNFTIEEIEDIKISISEACTNAIQHAYGDNPNPDKDVVDVKMYLTDSYLRIVVQDYGQGFDISILGTKEQKKRSEAKLGLGLGLTFIKSLMDESDFKSEIGKGTTIQMTKQAPNVVPAYTS